AGAATDVPDDGGTTPLMVAAASDNPEVVKTLLASGADPSRTDRTGRSALSYAVLKNARQCLPLFDAKK
ncbi:ankyrin repeat domain-containing protein, partial [Fretibacterium fastidiosum]